MDTDRELEELVRLGPRLSFFELVERLERLLRPRAAVGGLGPPADEAIRFRHDVRPIFHAGDVSGVERLRVDGRVVVEVTTTFLGLVGVATPLPGHVTEDLLAGEAQGEHGVRAFYDLFHHRLIALSYRALRIASPGASRTQRGDDELVGRITSFAGVPSRLEDAELGAPRAALASLAPILTRRPRSRAALEARLKHAVPGLAFRIEELEERTVHLPPAFVSRLGEDTMCLGETARVGDELVRQPGLLVVTTGPVSRAEYEALLPGGATFERVRATVLSATGGTLESELRVSFAPGEEPLYDLGASPLGEDTVLAGDWDGVRSWLTARIPLDADPGRFVETKSCRA